eukprot:9087391-Karenia_brevis.AAC.1
MACLAEGKNFEDDDEHVTQKGPKVLCALTKEDINHILTIQHRKLELQEDSRMEAIPTRHTTAYAQRAVQLASLRHIDEELLPKSVTALSPISEGDIS